MKILANLLIIFGILWCLLGGYYFWLRNNPNRLTFTNYHQTTTVIKSDKKQSQPQRIIISDLGIDLLLVASRVTNNKWETTNNGASYLSSSPIPGNTGNSVIYGHNWVSLFGKLVNAKPGQKVEVVFADGSKKKFIIEYTSTVVPTQASILAPSKDK